MPVLFDSSIYIAALRIKNGAALSLRIPAAERAVWLSAVVLEELYAGVRGRQRKPVERLERDFAGAGRVLVPALSDWTRTGDVLARLAAKYGYERIGQGRITNDALIAISAGRMGVTVITRNERDFARLAEFVPVHWQHAGI